MDSETPVDSAGRSPIAAALKQKKAALLKVLRHHGTRAEIEAATRALTSDIGVLDLQGASQIP